MNANELRVGDRTGYARSTRYGYANHGFGTVTKVNGHGHVTVEPEGVDGCDGNTIVFDKHGNERTESYSKRNLVTVGGLNAYLEREALRRDTNAAVKALVKELNERKNGYGDSCISAEAKAKLIEMVAALPVNYGG